jgi:hypothetical protein
MDVTLGVSAILFALIGLALAFLPLFHGKIPALSNYGFAASPFVSLAGAALACGGLLAAIRAFRSGREVRASAPLSIAILAVFLALAPLLPEANEFLGYRAICRDVPDGVTVYVRGHNRPQNMDVFLGRAIVVVGPDDPLPDDGALITKASFQDPALLGRECHIHGDSALWLPRER